MGWGHFTTSLLVREDDNCDYPSELKHEEASEGDEQRTVVNVAWLLIDVIQGEMSLEAAHQTIRSWALDEDCPDARDISEAVGRLAERQIGEVIRTSKLSTD